jgi:hypothetical protein
MKSMDDIKSEIQTEMERCKSTIQEHRTHIQELEKKISFNQGCIDNMYFILSQMIDEKCPDK